MHEQSFSLSALSRLLVQHFHIIYRYSRWSLPASPQNAAVVARAREVCAIIGTPRVRNKWRDMARKVLVQDHPVIQDRDWPYALRTLV